jgi:hypothetical protein
MKGGKGRGRAADRSARRESVNDRRAAAERGELPRDAGPERALVRDVVDARRNMLGLMLFVALGLFVVSFIGKASALVASIITSGLLAIFIVTIGDAFVLFRRIGTALDARFPDYRKPYRFYALQRAIAPRRIRVPKPRVKAGDPV